MRMEFLLQNDSDGGGEMRLGRGNDIIFSRNLNKFKNFYALTKIFQFNYFPR